MSTPVVAPITGIVWKILVNVGDQVTSNEVVALLESMKMEVPVRTPFAGIVQSVEVSSGDSVEDGDTLVTLIG
jgi:biotin carboxyl carrier protein